MGEAAGGGDGEDLLLERFRGGDPSAFEALLSRYEGALRYRIARRLPLQVRRRVSVDDVLQDMRVALFESRVDFEPRGVDSFLRWADGIAANRVRRALALHAVAAMRSVDREVPRRARPRTTQFPSRIASPSEEAVAHELEALAGEALECVSPEEREILRLTRDEGLSVAKAAERMDLGEWTARRLHARALAGLREALDRLRGEGR